MKKELLQSLLSLVKPLLFLLPLLSLHQETFSLTGISKLSDGFHTTLANADDSTNCGNQPADSLPGMVRFDHRGELYDYYYVRLSGFRSDFERLDFYQKAADHEIFIKDKNEFHSDSALFETSINEEKARLEFVELLKSVREVDSITPIADKKKILESSFFFKKAISESDPLLQSPLVLEIPCSTATIACSANTYTFPSTTGTSTAPAPVNGYPNYGCMHSVPCPAWFFMQVGTAGDILIHIVQTKNGLPPGGLDVDFVCWGPFTSLTDGCANGLTGTCFTTTAPTCCDNISCPAGFYPRGNIVDCSWSGNTTEDCHILNAQVGQIYILLITNFSTLPGTITFSQTGGSGITNCNLLVFCSMIDITANATACNSSTNTYSVSGTVDFSNPPPTGTLSITDYTAVPNISQVFNPPFTSPLNYTMNNIPCDGVTHIVTAAFSDSASCTLTGSYTSPPPTCPSGVIRGGGAICNNGASQTTVNIDIIGSAGPFNITYAINGVNQAPILNYSGPLPYIITTSTPGVYTLVSVSTSGCPGGGPVAGSATVTLNPLPTATISGTNSVCVDAAHPLITFTGASATAPYTFTYKINGGADQVITTTSGNSVSIAAPDNVPGTFVYSLVSVQDGSTPSCSQAQSGSATITVNPLPTATISGDISVCQNSAPPQITFTGASALAPYTFTYNINGGPPLTVTTTSGNSITVDVPTVTAGTFVYNLVSVTDASTTLCSQPQAGSATVIVNPLPTATVSGTIAVCQDATPPLVTFTGAAATAPYTFTYNINGGASQVITTTSGNSVTIAVPTNIAGTFTYNLLSVLDASSTTCSQPQSGSAIITVNPLPAATVSGSTAVCQNATAPMITFTGASATAPYTFTYNINGGASQVVTTTAGNSVTVAAPTNVTGTFAYNLLSVQDGSATLCSQAQSGIATVIVNPIPTATIAGTIAVCHNATAPVITFTGAAATAPYTFTYNINGGSVQTITTTSGNSISITAPTNVTGVFTYNLLGVQDASPTACSQPQAGSATVTVNNLPTAGISGTTAVCQNATAPLVTFTGASASAPYTFTYKVNGGANQVISTTAGNSVTVSAPTNVVGTFVYTLVSVQDGSTTSCSQAQSGSATVTVNPLPTASISGTITLCQNSTAPLITFTGASASAPYTFTYNINGGLNQTVSTTSGNSVTVAAPTNVPGTFAYNLVSVQDGSATACSQAQNGLATVIVTPLPMATISGTASVCLNSTQPLITFTGASSTAPYTFTYNINGGANRVVTTTSGNSVTVSAPTNVLGVYTYNLVSVHDGSPLSCSQAQGGSATVTVNLLPTATISGNTAVCQNATAPLITFTGASTAPPYTFTYNINGGSDQYITTSSGSSVTIPAPTSTVGTFAYNLTYVQDASATTCAQAQSGSATVTVHPLPTATISGTTAVCRNSATPFVTFTGASATPPYKFTYKINGGADQIVTTFSGNSVNVAVPTGTAGIFIYTLESVQDASSTTCSQAQSGNATITVNPLPTATISGTTAVCNNSASPLITFTGAAATAPYTFTYNINGGANLVISTTAGNSVTLPAPTSTVGTLLYNLVSVQDASTTTCSQSQSGSASVIVHPLPYVNLTACNDPKTTSTSRTFTLKGGSPPGGTYYIDGVAAAGGLFNPSVLSTTTHQVSYSYTDFNTCLSTSASVPIIVMTGTPTGSCPQNYTDPRDNSVYQGLYIGSHCWMLSNLNYGTKMSSANQHQSDNCSAEKYCLASDATCSTYGGLYQWDELMQYQLPAAGLTVQGLCPPEWHVPTQAEWQDLINSIASATPGDGLAGSFLKDPTPLWGFHALIDGILYQNNTWAFISGNLTATMYWTATANGTARAVARGMNNYSPSTSFYNSGKANAFPVRCVKD